MARPQMLWLQSCQGELDITQLVFINKHQSHASIHSTDNRDINNIECVQYVNEF
jgi:hypothetical protein